KTTRNKMADVVVISETIVRPDSYEEDGSDRVKIHVTQFDLMLLRSNYTQRGFFYPQPDPETHIIFRLKSSFSLVLKFFYSFAGCLVKIELHRFSSIAIVQPNQTKPTNPNQISRLSNLT
ncbi:unnamed protein product, partial [Thlaspi arvense]